MPNYCDNIATFRHKDPAMLKRAKDALMQERLFREFVPAPHEFVDGDGWPTEDWCDEHWGTERDVCVEGWTAGRYKCGVLEEGETFFSCAFLTAWAPPIAAFDALRQQGFKIDAIYMELGWVVSGTYRFGKHRCYNGDLPPELLRAFGYIEDDECGYRRENCQVCASEYGVGRSPASEPTGEGVDVCK